MNVLEHLKFNYTDSKPDKRRKIPKSATLEIVQLYKQGYSISALARHFKCSRSTIHFRLFPERLSKMRLMATKRKYDAKYKTKKLSSPSVGQEDANQV